MIRTALLALVAALLAAPLARAQDIPPCGPVQELEWTFRWRAPAEGTPVAEYAMLRSPFGQPLNSERIPVPSPTVTPDPPRTPIFSARVGGFRNDVTWEVALVSVGAGQSGESDPSNLLRIPAQVRGPCGTPSDPPPRPNPPTLLEFTAELEARAQELTEGLADLRQRIEREVPARPTVIAPQPELR